MDKLKEIVVEGSAVFINREMGHHLPVRQLVSFFELTDKSSEQYAVEYLPLFVKNFWLLERDRGRGNLLLTRLSKTDHTGSMMFKSGDCAGQRC